MEVWGALGLTLFAGMATAIGAIIAFTAKRTNYRFLSFSTGFSAGVMLYVSFVEILHKGLSALSAEYGDVKGNWINAAGFFGGIIFIGIIDYLVPDAENPHEIHSEKETAPLHDPSAQQPDFDAVSEQEKPAAGMHDHTHHHNHKLMRMGIFTALAIAIHNFPEGLVTFLAALTDPGLGIAIAIAIALHNIPEGISVSVPIYYATGNRKKAFFYSVISGLAEPVGAIFAYIMLRIFVIEEGGLIPPLIMGILMSGIAGIMVYISLDELLPASRAYGKGHDSIFGLLAGMIVMALSLLMMQ